MVFNMIKMKMVYSKGCDVTNHHTLYWIRCFGMYRRTGFAFKANSMQFLWNKIYHYRKYFRYSMESKWHTHGRKSFHFLIHIACKALCFRVLVYSKLWGMKLVLPYGHEEDKNIVSTWNHLQMLYSMNIEKCG